MWKWHMRLMEEAGADGADAGAAGTEAGATDTGSQQPQESMGDAISKMLKGEGDAGDAGTDEGAQPDDHGADGHGDAAAAPAAADEGGAAGAQDGTDTPPQEGQAGGDQPQDLTDEDLAPIEGLGKRAADRIEKLTTGYKTVQAQRDEARSRNVELEHEVTAARQESDGIVRSIMDAGMDNDSFNLALDFSKMVNSGDPAQIDQAAEILIDQLRQISLLTGKPYGGIDALTGHDDLRTAVDNLEMTRAYALELAQNRQRGNRPAPMQQQPAPQDQQQAQQQGDPNAAAYQQAVQKAEGEINALQEGWRTSDPDFEGKMRRLFTPDASGQNIIQQIVANNPGAPHLWAGEVKRLWAMMGTTQPKQKTPRPLSGGSRPAGAPEPKSMQEAIQQSLNGG